MKKIVISMFFLFIALNSNISSASSSYLIPDEVSVREHWISLTKSYDIETQTQKLGTLYQPFFSLLPTYDFYDPMNVKTATAKAQLFSLGIRLDIYDQFDVFLGGVEEKIFTFYPTFEIIANDSSTKLARAEMNFWGTKFYIYDAATGQEMVTMSRAFFRLKNDWTINVINRSLLDQKNIDPRVLMTVLAVQGEIEEWELLLLATKNSRLRSATVNSSRFTAADSDALSKQIADISEQQGLSQFEDPSKESMEALADELDQAFKTENQSSINENQTNQERIQAFTSFCLNLINSNELPDAKKKAIVSLLKLRLLGHN